MVVDLATDLDYRLGSCDGITGWYMITGWEML